jgi:hypothetical protein
MALLSPRPMHATAVGLRCRHSGDRHGRRRTFNAVAARMLRRVQRLIGCGDDRLRRLSRRREFRDPDRHRDFAEGLAPVDRLDVVCSLANTFGGRQRRRGGDAGQQEDELFAAAAGNVAPLRQKYYCF